MNEIPAGLLSDPASSQKMSQQFMETQNAPDNVRIKLQPSDSQLSGMNINAAHPTKN